MVDDVCRKTDLGSEDTAEFSENHFRGDELVLGQDVAEHIGTEPSCGEGAHQNVRVEEDLQEMFLKMSSSVR